MRRSGSPASGSASGSMRRSDGDQHPPRPLDRRDPDFRRHLRHRLRRERDELEASDEAPRSQPAAAFLRRDRLRRGIRPLHQRCCRVLRRGAAHLCRPLGGESTLMFFRKRKHFRYPRRPPLPIIRRKLPTRYHMKHQFTVRDLAFRQTMHALTGSPLLEGNRVEILRNGVQIFPAMLAAIRAAQKTINLEFYIYWDGEIAKQFAEALAERARAGVQVKAILDSVG